MNPMTYNYTQNALQKKLESRCSPLRIASRQIITETNLDQTSSAVSTSEALIKAHQLIDDLMMTIKTQEATIEEMSALNHELLYRNQLLVKAINK